MQDLHRALADIEALPELKARHLALATVSSDPATLQALDTAADAARTRGAPAAAAELVDLAIRLGGDTPERRIRAAAHLFHAGNAEPARALLEPMVSQLPPSPLRATAVNLLAAQVNPASTTSHCTTRSEQRRWPKNSTYLP